MSLVKFKRRRPFGSLMKSDFFDMDDFFDNRFWGDDFIRGRFWNGKTIAPAMNIKETEDDFEIELAAPGFAKKDFNVTLENGCLNISAEKTVSEEEKEENYTRREFSYDAFERSLQLPESVKEEAVKAKYNDGILSFKLAKKEESKKQKPKVIEVA
ncbi:Hsp20/alpha crystallin family protein [Poritiphilus flavus]|uniref:Hsp20 family protein n=1 Tax=Poritiphilus flavus TaxID=2697053 RepID=A0A6L9ED13_9FLAO|nr:Hsp20/alpha crystallin family protein [Poritiphilus flavus]NAS12279.1 Hsp20 family protein [Poritiphilus flavus]